MTTANGAYSHAEGSGTAANGDSSHAQGEDTRADGKASHAEGKGTAASQFASHAEGIQTAASGIGTHAEGYQTIASGFLSSAAGKHTDTAQLSGAAIIGKFGTLLRATPGILRTELIQINLDLPRKSTSRAKRQSTVRGLQVDSIMRRCLKRAMV